MSKIRKDQKGFTLVEGLLVIIALALVVGVGFYVMNANKDKKDDTVTSASTEKTQEKTQPAADQTADWTSYSSPLGKFSVKYPKTWATASNPDYCSNTAETGIFLLGANSASVGKCATDAGSQMSITWRTDRQFCGDLNNDTWTQDSKQSVTVSGVSATKIEATAKEAQGIGDPAGTKLVQYCAVANNATYIASYTQLSSYPDALSDFNTMVTKTLKLN